MTKNAMRVGTKVKSKRLRREGVIEDVMEVENLFGAKELVITIDPEGVWPRIYYFPHEFKVVTPKLQKIRGLLKKMYL